MNVPFDQRLREALNTVTRALLAERVSEGHWRGELSTSALSTATAVIALATVDRQGHAALIDNGLRWLARHANLDGGWGDTVRSQSNLSTTALAWAAFGAARCDAQFSDTVGRAAGWITRRAGSLQNLVPTIEDSYGADRTFSVPITMVLALSGRLGQRGWTAVRPLPFELGALPPGWFGALRRPVVSYALPALIAIGQVIHHFAPQANPVTRILRRCAKARTLDRLAEIQPPNGGFLEAVPLTSFVVMSLAAMGLRVHDVTRRGTSFLTQSVRPDGSWPIDTNLATWVTTLSIKALAHQPEVVRKLSTSAVSEWLLQQQYRRLHPYTQAAPGGWAWTDLPGGVPDADDTAGALLAIHSLADSAPSAQALDAARTGVTWLLDLQNRDGGIPTFCRGWGTLPFDRSAPELTAHALRAWNAWMPRFDIRLQNRIRRATLCAYRFLERSQQADGSWLPLWFGNEAAPKMANPVYGTAHVLLSLRMRPLYLPPPPDAPVRAGTSFLVRAQNADGGWGGSVGIPSSIEETAMALESLLKQGKAMPSVGRGLAWIVSAIEADQHQIPAPIGLYFARLWYFERLYPLLFAASALGAANQAGIAHLLLPHLSMVPAG